MVRPFYTSYGRRKLARAMGLQTDWRRASHASLMWCGVSLIFIQDCLVRSSYPSAHMTSSRLLFTTVASSARRPRQNAITYTEIPNTSSTASSMWRRARAASAYTHGRNGSREKRS